jgi:hypothetical protein
MKRFGALLVASAFLAEPAGFGVAPPSPAQAQEKKAEEKKSEMKSDAKMEKKAEKKPAVKTTSGTVKSASADSIVVAGKAKGKEEEWTFGVDGKTSIKKGGKSVTAADLKPGDSVQVKYTEDGGKTVAQSVTARGPAATAKGAEEKKAAGPSGEPRPGPAAGTPGAKP